MYIAFHEVHLQGIKRGSDEMQLWIQKGTTKIKLKDATQPY